VSRNADRPRMTTQGGGQWPVPGSGSPRPGPPFPKRRHPAGEYGHVWSAPDFGERNEVVNKPREAAP
jgi:hypothetical protein